MGQNGNQPGPEPAMVLLPRHGRPPLRMRAAAVARHRAPVGPDRLEVALWRRPRGGYAVSVLRPEGDAIVEDAAAAPDLGDLADWVEALCRDLGRGRAANVAAPDLVDALVAQQRAQQLARAFLVLVGDALADWPALPVGGRLMQGG